MSELDLGYCTNCFSEFYIGPGNDGPTVTCSKCGSEMTWEKARENYVKYLDTKSDSIDSTSRTVFTDKIAKEKQEIDRLKKEHDRLIKEHQKKIDDLERKLETSIGVDIYEPDPGVYQKPISCKLPEGMYDLVSSVIKVYYNESMTTYIQSLIAADIQKNLDAYREYAKNSQTTKKIKKDDVFIREEFYQSFKEETGMVSSRMGIDPKVRKGLIEYFNKRVMEGIYIIRINGKVITGYDIEHMYDLVDKQYYQYLQDNQAKKEESRNKHEEWTDTLPGMPVALIYRASKDEDNRKIVRHICGNLIRGRDKDSFIETSFKIEKLTVAYDLFDLFLYSRYANYVLKKVEPGEVKPSGITRMDVKEILPPNLQ